MDVKVTNDMLLKERQDSIGLSFDPSIYKFSIVYDEDGNPVSSKQKDNKKNVKKKKKRFGSKETKEAQNERRLDDNNGEGVATPSSPAPPKPEPEPLTWWGIAVGCLGLIGAGIGGWGMAQNISDASRRVLVKFIAPAISGAHGVAMGPVIVYQRSRLDKDSTIRELVQELKVQHERLKKENDTLKSHVDDLKMEVDHLGEIESALQEICADQEASLDYLNKKIKENAQINKELLEIIKARTWQEIQSIVLESDKSFDFTLSHREIEGLIFRLKFIETIYIDEDLLREELKRNGGSLNVLLNFVREALVRGSTKNAMISVKKVSTVIKEQKSKRSQGEIFKKL